MLIYHQNSEAMFEDGIIEKKASDKGQNQNNMSDIERVEFCVKALENQGHDITGTYDPWFETAMSLASLREPGREYFHRVSSMHPKYDYKDADLKFTNALNTGNGSINLGTFFYYCKEAGIELPKNNTSTTGGKKPIVKKKFKLNESEKLAMKARTLPDLKMIWGRYIFERTLTIFAAERGTGKSFLALQLCLAIAYKFSSFLGEVINHWGNTLFIDFEMGEYLMSKRLEDLYSDLKVPKGDFSCSLVFPQGSLTEYMESLEEAIKELTPVLVVVDNLKLAFKGTDFMKNHETIEALDALNELKKKYGCSFLIVAHTKKGTRYDSTQSDLVSGSGSISDIADADFFLRRTKVAHEKILKRDKSRVTEATDQAKLIAMGDTSRWFTVIAEDINEADYLPNQSRPSGGGIDEKVEIAHTMHKNGRSYSEIAADFGVSKSCVQKWINRARA